MTWVAMLVLAAGTYGFRVAGPLLRSRITLPEPVRRYLALGAVVLLAALVATATVIDDRHLAGGARPAGVLVGALLALRRAPFIVVVVAAAGVAALLRHLGVG